MDAEQEFTKLRYHIASLADCINNREHPITSLVVRLNWGEDDLDRAQDVFEKHSNILSDTGKFSAVEFEHELKQEFNLNYQSIKTIVCAFWDSSQWTDIAIAYAEQNQCTEFHRILDDR